MAAQRTALEAERALLGGLLRDPGQFAEIAAHVSAADFYTPHHQTLYRMIADRVRSGRPVDLVLWVADTSVATWQLVGGAAYVAGLDAYCPSTANLRHYADAVRASSVQRQLLKLAADLVAGVEGGDLDPAELAEQVARAATELAAPLSEPAIDVTQAFVEAERERAEGVLVWRTGYPELDRLLDGGLRARELVVVGARPSHGKTSLGISLALQVSEEGPPACVISCEMRRPAIGDRAMALLARVPLGAIRTGHRTPEQGALLEDWSALETKTYVWHRAGASLTDVLAAIRHEWATKQARVFVVDFLTLIREPPAYRGEPEPLRFGRIAIELKRLALQLDVCVVLLSQLGRDYEKRARVAPAKGGGQRAWWTEIATPTPADLVWSGEVEQVADLIVFPIIAGKTEHRGVPADSAVLLVAKNRNGETGAAPCRWHGPTAAFLAYGSTPDKPRAEAYHAS